MLSGSIGLRLASRSLRGWGRSERYDRLPGERAPDTPAVRLRGADRLAGVTRGTSRRWLKGYRYWYADESRLALPITPERDLRDGVSFVDLVEVIAIGKLRQRGFSLRRIRQINEYCQLALNRERPLVTETFKTDGREVFVKAQGGFLLDVLHGRGTQAWDEVLDPFLETLDYEDELARRWWPRGKRSRSLWTPTTASACRW